MGCDVGRTEHVRRVEAPAGVVNRVARLALPEALVQAHVLPRELMDRENEQRGRWKDEASEE